MGLGRTASPGSRERWRVIKPIQRNGLRKGEYACVSETERKARQGLPVRPHQCPYVAHVLGSRIFDRMERVVKPDEREDLGGTK